MNQVKSNYHQTLRELRPKDRHKLKGLMKAAMKKKQAKGTMKAQATLSYKHK